MNAAAGGLVADRYGLFAGEALCCVLPVKKQRGGRIRAADALPLAAGWRQQASPVGGKEAGEEIVRRERRRARAPSRLRKALARRAATRHCRAAIGRSHVWPPRSPSLSLLARGSIFLPSRIPSRSKLPSEPSAVHGAKARRHAKGLVRSRPTETQRGPDRIWQNPSIPEQQGCETRPAY